MQLQTQIPGWSWQNGILICDLLANWRHGFFTKLHAPQPPQSLQALLGSKTAYRVKQVHGDRLVDIKDLDPATELVEADGIWAIANSMPHQQPNISLWVCSADCVPVLIGDRILGSVVAIHAGWRGTAANILVKAIQGFLSQGSQVENLVVALGPAISGANYQVSQSVADQVLATIITTTGIQPDVKPEHCRLDIRLVQKQQLKELGIESSQVAIAPYCTYIDADLFFSYRRKTLETHKNPAVELQSPQAQQQIQWTGISS